MLFETFKGIKWLLDRYMTKLFTYFMMKRFEYYIFYI